MTRNERSVADKPCRWHRAGDPRPCRGKSGGHHRDSPICGGDPDTHASGVQITTAWWISSHRRLSRLRAAPTANLAKLPGRPNGGDEPFGPILGSNDGSEFLGQSGNRVDGPSGPAFVRRGGLSRFVQPNGQELDRARRSLARPREPGEATRARKFARHRVPHVRRVIASRRRSFGPGRGRGSCRGYRRSDGPCRSRHHARCGDGARKWHLPPRRSRARPRGC